jgi:hypothetical protein
VLNEEGCATFSWNRNGRARPDFAEKEKREAEIVEGLTEAGIFLSEDGQDSLDQGFDLSLLNQLMARGAGRRPSSMNGFRTSTSAKGCWHPLKAHCSCRHRVVRINEEAFDPAF